MRRNNKPFKKLNFKFIYKVLLIKQIEVVIRVKGCWDKKGLEILSKVKEKYNCPVISDVHEISQIKEAKRVLDVIQIPAFLSRQTDLLVEAGKSGVPVNVKKGQFLAPWDMKNVVKRFILLVITKFLLLKEVHVLVIII